MPKINALLGGSISDKDIKRIRELRARDQLNPVPGNVPSGQVTDQVGLLANSLSPPRTGGAGMPGASSESDRKFLQETLLGDQIMDDPTDADRLNGVTVVDDPIGDLLEHYERGDDVRMDDDEQEFVFEDEDEEAKGLFAPGVGDAFQGKEALDAAVNRSSAANNAPVPAASVLPPPVGAPPLPGGPGGVLGGAPPSGAPPMAPEMQSTMLPPAAVLMQQYGANVPPEQMAPQQGTGVPGQGAPGTNAPAFGPGAMADAVQPLQTVGVPPPMRGVTAPVSPAAGQPAQMLQQSTGSLPVPTPNPDAIRQLEAAWQANKLRRRMMGLG